MVYSLQEGMDARWITILTLLVTVMVLFYFLYSHKEEPSGKLRCSGHNLAGSGEKFSFSSLVDG